MNEFNFMPMNMRRHDDTGRSQKIEDIKVSSRLGA